jgi:hypothetical protein
MFFGVFIKVQGHIYLKILIILRFEENMHILLIISHSTEKAM